MTQKNKTDQKLEEWIRANPILVSVIGGGGLLLLFGKPIFSSLAFHFPKEKLIELQSIVEGIVIVAGLLFLARFVWIQFFARKQWRYERLLPHEDDQFRPQDVLKMLERLQGSRRNNIKRLFLGKEWFSYTLYRDEEGQVGFYIGATNDLMPFIQSSIKSVYGRAEFYPGSLPMPQDFGKKQRFSGRMKMHRKRNRNALPLAEYTYDDLPVLIREMPPETWLQVLFSPNSGRKLKEKMIERETNIKEVASTDRNTFDKQELKGLKDRNVNHRGAFDVVISMASVSSNAKNQVKQMGNLLRASLSGLNTVKYRKLRNSVRAFPHPYRYTMMMTSEELANIVHLPLFDKRQVIDAIKLITPRSKRGAELIPKNVMANPNDVFIGYLEHPIIKNRAVYLQKAFIGEHFGLFGKTGSGKSTVLNTLLSQGFVKDFIEQETAAGFTFADPARDTVIVILNQLLHAEQQGAIINWDKVHYFSVANSTHPFAMNLLYKMPGQKEGVIADAVTELIEANFPQPAAVAARLLRFCIRTLLADPYETHTILEVNRLLDDITFRKQLLRVIGRDPRNYEIMDYWQNDAEGNIKTSALAVKNRIDMFASSESLKRIFGQKEFEWDVRQYMDEGHLVLLDVSNLSKSEIGLVVGYLEYMYYRIAETRPPYSLLHLFVVDERHKVNNVPVTPRIIAESRKFGLASGTATQRLLQLSEGHREAITEIQDNFFVCQQGSKDAETAAKYLSISENDQVNPKYLTNLEPRRAVIRFKEKVDGVVSTYRTTVVVPPLDKYKPDGQVANYLEKEDVKLANDWTYEKARELEAREGKTIEEVDLAIMKYMNPNQDFSEIEEEQKQMMTEQEIEDGYEALLEQLGEPPEELEEETPHKDAGLSLLDLAKGEKEDDFER
ncbi:helicase HerA domain-containing protein [Listeria aquatica]|uniref:helicase HerA domain-containing protein n=1 Tax=Listeria aquatica TaxID=1494960 RepID=UPI003EF5425C